MRACEIGAAAPSGRAFPSETLQPFATSVLLMFARQSSRHCGDTRASCRSLRVTFRGWKECRRSTLYFFGSLSASCSASRTQRRRFTSASSGSGAQFCSMPTHRSVAPQPDQRHLRCHGSVVTIDSRRLRSTTVWSAQADAKILFVGDSVTWAGTYIDNRDTFSERVCGIMTKATGNRYGCGNAGANQYGLDNMSRGFDTGISKTNKRSW